MASLKASDYNNLEGILAKSAFINPLSIALDYERKCMPELVRTAALRAPGNEKTQSTRLQRIHSLGEFGGVFEQQRGKFLVGEIVNKPQVINFGLIRFVVQIKSKQEFIWVHLYNLAPLGSSSSSSLAVVNNNNKDQAAAKLMMIEDEFALKSTILIKHPTLVKTLENELAIHVVDPFDVVSMDEMREEEEEEFLLGEEWKIREVLDDSERDALREQGNKHYKDGNIHQALRIYRKCVRSSEVTDFKALGNLIHMNYLLRRHHVSLAECEKALSALLLSGESNNNNKSDDAAAVITRMLYRKYLNLIALERFEDANKMLLEGDNGWSAQKFPIFKTAKEKDFECGKNAAYANQQKNGIYSWNDLFAFGGGKSNDNPPKFCDYVGPIAVQTSKGCGRGLFATRAVKQGEILFVCNPLAMAEIASGSPIFSNAAAVKINDFAHRTLLREVCKAISNDARLYERVNVLSGGANDDEISIKYDLRELYSPNFSPQSKATINTERLFDVIKTNSFNNGARTAMEHHKFAIFPITAFCNHSCVPNTLMLYAGNTHVVKAAKDLTGGEEITIRYFQSQGKTLQERRGISQNWGFQCACLLCEREAKEWVEGGEPAVSSFSGFSSNLLARFAQLQQVNITSQNAMEIKQKNESLIGEIDKFLNGRRSSSISSKQQEQLEEWLIKSIFLPVYLVQMHLLTAVKAREEEANAMEETIYKIMDTIEPCSYEHVRFATISLLQKKTPSPERKQAFIRWKRLCMARYGDVVDFKNKQEEEEEEVFFKKNPFYEKLLKTLREAVVSRAKRFDFCETFRG